MPETTATTSSGDANRGWLAPAAFAHQLERRGPIFVKLGQFLALRPDLIPQAYCDELLKLLDRVPPFPWRDARAVLIEDLGAPPAERFAFFNQTPIASASLAQVYFARTHDGHEVAVKVQRPGLRERLDADLRRADWVLRALEVAGRAPFVDRRELLDELGRWLRAELDFGVELQNVTLIRGLAESGGRIRIPRSYPELSGPRVVTTSFLRGVPFSELLAAIREGRPDRIDRFGFDRKVLAESFLLAVFTQIFKHQTFHADVHPGNVLAIDSDRIGFVDFGLIDTLDETIRERQTLYLAAIYGGDVEEMFRSLVDVLDTGADTDLDAFHGDFVKVTRAWLRERRSQARLSRPPGVAGYLVDLMRTIRVHGLRLPSEVLSMYRTLLTAETVAEQLDGGATLMSVGRGFFDSLRVGRAVEALMPDRVQGMAVELLGLAGEAPAQVRRLLSDLADDRFVLRMHTTTPARERREANARARLSALAGLSVGLAVLIAATSWRPPFAWPVHLVLWGALAIVYALMAVAWWRLR